MKIVALIPAYNEKETIGEIVSQTKNYVEEVVVVDDASTDSTPLIAREEGAKVFSHILNRGIGATQRTGYRYAIDKNFDYVIQLDADGQHDPKYIPQLLEAILKGYDMIIGSRFLGESYKEYSLVRKIGIVFFTKFTNLLTNSNITDITSGFRVYKTEALKKLSPIQDRHWAIEQTFEAIRKGLKIKEIPMEMPVRKTGQSQFNLRRFFWYPFQMMEIILRVLIFRR